MTLAVWYMRKNSNLPPRVHFIAIFPDETANNSSGLYFDELKIEDNLCTLLKSEHNMVLFMSDKTWQKSS